MSINAAAVCEKALGLRHYVQSVFCFKKASFLFYELLHLYRFHGSL